MEHNGRHKAQLITGGFMKANSLDHIILPTCKFGEMETHGCTYHYCLCLTDYYFYCLSFQLQNYIKIPMVDLTCQEHCCKATFCPLK